MVVAVGAEERVGAEAAAGQAEGAAEAAARRRWGRWWRRGSRWAAAAERVAAAAGKVAVWVGTGTRSSCRPATTPGSDRRQQSSRGAARPPSTLTTKIPAPPRSNAIFVPSGDQSGL